MNNAEIAVVIPCLEPNNHLLDVLEGMLKAGFNKFIIINDGSNNEYDHYFDVAESRFCCIVLKHPVNYGKGIALKTAYKYILEKRPEIEGILTIDSDGQHAPEDARMVVDVLYNFSDELILGCRDFSKKNVPIKSRMGNKITRGVMSLLTTNNGTECNGFSDTQTGLRAFHRKYLEMSIKIPGKRFEYETNVLLAFRKLQIPIREVTIKTIYYNDNNSTHFDSIKDSWSIYKSILKFSLASLSSFFVDIALFAGCELLFSKSLPDIHILISTFASRGLSSIYNYTINNYFVFNRKKHSLKYFTKYYFLFFIIMFCSAFGVNFIYSLSGGNSVLIKILVDSVLFIFSYLAQKHFVFSEKNKTSHNENAN